MQYYPIDSMKPGDKIHLLVSTIKGETAWKNRTVEIARVPAGFVYSVDGIAKSAVDIAGSSFENPGHAGLYMLVKAETRLDLFEALPALEKVHKYYAARRRNVVRKARPLRNTDYGSAAKCLKAARDDMAAGKAIYTGPEIWRKPLTNGQPNPDGHLWIECPADMGLRFVGYADNICRSIGHTGWYADPCGESKIRGCVYQLPGRNGKARFVAAHDNDDNGAADSGGPAYVDFSEIYEESTTYYFGKTAYGNGGFWSYSDSATDLDACTDAARSADGFAERQAEKEREYQTAWQAGLSWRDTCDKIIEARRHALEILKERREARKDETRYPAICAALKSQIESILEDIREARDKRRDLAAGDYENLIFYPSDDLKAAFCEGASLQEFPA